MLLKQQKKNQSKFQTFQYTRTRNCLSGGFSCACVGESEETKFGK